MILLPGMLNSPYADMRDMSVSARRILRNGCAQVLTSEKSFSSQAKASPMMQIQPFPALLFVNFYLKNKNKIKSASRTAKKSVLTPTSPCLTVTLHSCWSETNYVNESTCILLIALKAEDSETANMSLFFLSFQGTASLLANCLGYKNCYPNGRGLRECPLPS